MVGFFSLDLHDLFLGQNAGGEGVAHYASGIDAECPFGAFDVFVRGVPENDIRRPLPEFPPCCAFGAFGAFMGDALFIYHLYMCGDGYGLLSPVFVGQEAAVYEDGVNVFEKEVGLHLFECQPVAFAHAVEG